MYLCSPPKTILQKQMMLCSLQPFQTTSLQTSSNLLDIKKKKKSFNSQLRSCSLNAAKDSGALAGPSPGRVTSARRRASSPGQALLPLPARTTLHPSPQLIKAPGDWPQASGLLIKRRHFSPWKIGSISFTEQHFLPLSDVLIRFQTGEVGLMSLAKVISSENKPESLDSVFKKLWIPLRWHIEKPRGFQFIVGSRTPSTSRFVGQLRGRDGEGGKWGSIICQ